MERRQPVWTNKRPQRGGLTMLELMVVLGVLLVLSTLVIPVIGSRMEQSQELATASSLQRIRDMLVDTYLDDLDNLPRPGIGAQQAGRPDHPQLAYLFINPLTHLDGDATTRDHDVTFDPISRRGWRGPYLLHQGDGFVYSIDPGPGFGLRYGQSGDPAVLDGWGNPIVLQEPVVPGMSDYERRRHARLVSAGPNGVIDTDPDQLFPTDTGDDLVLFLWMAMP